MSNNVNHMQNEANMTSTLVDFSEDLPSVDKINQATKVTCDWNEAVKGWKNVVPYPQYVPQQVSLVIKKRNIRNDKMPDWHRNVTSYDDMMGEGKICIRCIGDDFENIPVPSWKANVEQGTYRYVPNNGYYRTIKFLQADERRDWFTVTKKQPEKVSMNWQNKRFQKEIRRHLRKEFDNYQSNYYQHQQQQLQNHKVQQDHLPTHSPQVHSQQEQGTQETGCVEPKLQVEKIVSVPTHYDIHLDSYRLSSRRVRSTQSETSTPETRVSSSKTHRRDNAGNSSALSLRSAPVSYYKSTSDLYIENFSHRLNALEAELKRDSRVVRKAHEDAAKPPPGNTKHKVKEPVYQKSREIKETTPRQIPAPRKEIVTQESFTIKAVGSSRDHRPTEKNTPALKLVSASDKSGVTQLKYTTTTGTNAANITLPTIQAQIGAGDLDKTLNSYKLAIETTKQSLFHTLSATKIPRRGTNKAFSTQTAIAVCEGANGTGLSDKNGKEGFITNGTSGHHHHDLDRDIEKKAAIPGILPEISGKRLEVPPTAHRWL